MPDESSHESPHDGPRLAVVSEKPEVSPGAVVSEKPEVSPGAVVSEKPEVSPEAGESTAPVRRGRNPLLWILAAAFLLCALGWFFQAREVRELAASLEVTRTALGRAQAELRAYDRHLSLVGDQVGVLREQLDSLQALVEEGPGPSQEP